MIPSKQVLRTAAAAVVVALVLARPSDEAAWQGDATIDAGQLRADLKLLALLAGPLNRYVVHYRTSDGQAHTATVAGRRLPDLTPPPNRGHRRRPRRPA